MAAITVTDVCHDFEPLHDITSVQLKSSKDVDDLPEFTPMPWFVESHSVQICTV